MHAETLALLTKHYVFWIWRIESSCHDNQGRKWGGVGGGGGEGGGGGGGGGGDTPPPIFKHSVLHDGYYKVGPKPNPEPVLCAMVISPICMEHYGNSIVRQNISK
jgi:hypothetical protein